MNTLSTTEALLERLLHHPLPEIELSLERIGIFLQRMGNPHLRLPPVVHVAGTNGKGSTIAFLRAIMEAAGKRCHVYTSPHLVRFHERIVVAGQEIDDMTLRQLLTQVVEASEDFPLTYFESTTVAAMMAFADTPADLVLLETGMGGRLDATNVIPSPALTVITPISIDHAEFLGDTIAKIAGEKAGIIKEGVPCVIGAQAPEALQVLRDTAAAIKAPLYVYGENYRIDDGGYYSSQRELAEIKPGLPGAFQMQNAAAAIACAEQLSDLLPVDEEAIKQGVERATWHARLQQLTMYGRTIWLDGGHNPAAGEALAAWLEQQGKTMPLIMAMLQDKDVHGYLRPLAGHITSVIAIPIPGESKSMRPEQIRETAQTFGMNAECTDALEDALGHLQDCKEILVAGSLYLAGDVLAKNAVHNGK